MKKNKVYLGLLLFVISAVILYGAYGVLYEGRREQYYSVSVIVDDSSSDRWNAFWEGLNQGAQENNIYLSLVSVGELSGLQEECQIISRELENGADGIIVEPCALEDTDGIFARTLQDCKAVLVQTALEPERGDSQGSGEQMTVIMPDHQQIGQALADAVAEGEAEALEGLTIGVLSGDQRLLAMQQRLEAFETAAEEMGARVLWSLSRNNLKYSDRLSRTLSEQPVDILVTLDNDATETAVDYLLQHKTGLRLYAEGRSEKAVYYLDKGVIRAMVVPNEFYMGYESVTALAQKLNYYTDTASTDGTTVDFLTVTKDNLYDEAIAKILFPTVL